MSSTDSRKRSMRQSLKYCFILALGGLITLFIRTQDCSNGLRVNNDDRRERNTEEPFPDKEPTKPNFISRTGDDPEYHKIVSSLNKKGQFVIGTAFISFLEMPGAIEACPSGTTTFVFICSAPTYPERRQAIRETWLSPEHQTFMKKHGVFAAFITGIPENGALFQEAIQILHAESQQHKDLIIMSHKDSYKSLSYKSIAGHAWGLEYCPTARIHVKLDDDVFLNTPRMLEYIEDTMKNPTPADELKSFIGKYKERPIDKYSHTDLVMMAPLWSEPGFPLHRDPASPWYVPPEVYQPGVYPGYGSGLFRACTSAFAKACLNATFGRQLIVVEDALVSGVIAEEVGARRIYHEYNRDASRGNYPFATTDHINNWLADEGGKDYRDFVLPIAFNTPPGPVDLRAFKKAADVVLEKMKESEANYDE